MNLLAQYRPCGDARRYPEIARRITATEFLDAVRIAHDEGLDRLDGL